VLVQERVNGKMLITHNDTSLKFKEITTRPEWSCPYQTGHASNLFESLRNSRGDLIFSALCG